MNIKNDQKGVALVIMILSVLVLFAIFGVGWKVWDSGKNNNLELVQTSSPTKTDIETPQQIIEPTYLVIKEWGVKFRLDKSVSDTTYILEDEKNNWVILTTPRLTELADSSPTCRAAKNSVSIARAKVGDDRFGSPWTKAQLEEIGFMVNDYYYYADGGQACFGSEESLVKDTAIVEEVGIIRTKLSEIHKSVMKN